MRNLPIMVFRKMNRILSERFTDVVESIFIYSNSKFVAKLWPIIKMIVDPETREKVQILNTSPNFFYGTIGKNHEKECGYFEKIEQIFCKDERCNTQQS